MISKTLRACQRAHTVTLSQSEHGRRHEGIQLRAKMIELDLLVANLATVVSILLDVKRAQVGAGCGGRVLLSQVMQGPLLPDLSGFLVRRRHVSSGDTSSILKMRRADTDTLTQLQI